MEAEAYQEMADTEDRHWWFLGRRKIVRSILQGLNLRKKASILEIGCGTGGNLELLASFGEVSAIEMDEKALALARQKTGEKGTIAAGRCPGDMPFEGRKFDLICLFDVLEHIEEDVQTLQAIRKMLQSDGQVLITVPAYQWLWGPHDEFLHHKRRYTVGRLQEKATAAGFSVQRRSYFNTLLFPLAAMVRLADALLGKRTSSGSKVPAPLINTLLEKIFSLERQILGYVNLPFGVSILVILKHE